MYLEPHAESFPFNNSDFASDSLPTIRAASVFAGADEATLEAWLHELAATSEGSLVLFDIVRSIKLVSRRFTTIVDMLDETGERLGAMLERIADQTADFGSTGRRIN